MTAAFASRYPKASALGLSARQQNKGFSPRDIPSVALAAGHVKASRLALSGPIKAEGFSPWTLLLGLAGGFSPLNRTTHKKGLQPRAFALAAEIGPGFSPWTLPSLPRPQHV